MYRIKLASGQETIYPSIDDLTRAVQNGEVTGEALIYHQRADRWLSVSNHPHYQVAINRAKAARNGAPDPSRRQVISAVRAAPPPESQVPPTAVRGEIMDVVAQLDAPREAPRPVKRISIPTIKRPEERPVLQAYENVIEGVKVEGKGNGNGHPPRVNGSATTAMPVRAPAAPAHAPVKAEPQVPDLDNGLELVEPDTPLPLSNTPQVEKLLSLLEPAHQANAPAIPAPVSQAAVPAPAPPAVAAAEPLAEAEVISLEPAYELAPLKAPAPARKSGSKMPLMMGLAATVVIAAGVGIWQLGSRGGQAEAEIPAPIVTIPEPRTDAFGGMTTVDTAAPPAAAAARSDSAGRSTRPDTGTAIISVAAPRISLKAPLPTALDAPGPVHQEGVQIPATTLIQHYTAAYADARGEMELRMLQLGFTQMFLRNRLATSGGLQDSRRLVAAASSVLRQYRAQEASIERAYADTVGTNGRNIGWSSRELGTWNVRPSPREQSETARLTNLMVDQMDSVYALLLAQDGKYQWSGDVIVFQDAEAAKQYGALRAWLNRQADNYAGTADAAMPATLRQVVKAIGSSRLPLERAR